MLTLPCSCRHVQWEMHCVSCPLSLRYSYDMECAEPSSCGLPVIDTLPAAESLISEVLDAGKDDSVRLRYPPGREVWQNTDLPAAIFTLLTLPKARKYRIAVAL